MKKLLFVLPMLFSLNSQATIIQDGTVLDGVACIKNSGDALGGFGCAFFTTVSLPTVIIADKELNLSSEEAGLMILAEAVSESDNDPVSQALANHLGKDISEVQATAIQYYSDK